MKLSITAFIVTSLWASFALGQGGQIPNCSDELLMDPDCYEVASPVACYNQFRWNQQTLTCINGSDAEKKAKFCKCAKCVGTPMVNWVTKGNYCAAGGANGRGKKRAVQVRY